MQVEQLYREVSDEVRDLYGALLLESNERQQQSSRDLEQFVSTWTLRLGLIAIVAAILGINLRGYTVQADGIPWWHAVLFVFLGVAASVLIQWERNRRKGLREGRAAASVKRSKAQVTKAAAGEN
jgi:cytochrome bd-type quinol oxidase subunit 2